MTKFKKIVQNYPEGVIIVVIDEKKELDREKLKKRIKEYKKEFKTDIVRFLDFRKDLSPSEWVLCKFMIPVFIYVKNGIIDAIIYGY